MDSVAIPKLRFYDRLKLVKGVKDDDERTKGCDACRCA